MRALYISGAATFVAACSLGALDGFSGTETPDGGITPTGEGGPSTTDGAAASAPSLDAPTTSAYHTAVGADGPVAHFALEETSGAACASSTTTSAVCVYPSDNASRGKPGIGGTKALHFDTNTATLTISGLPGDLSLPYSVELWLRADASTTPVSFGSFMNPGVGHPGPGFNLFLSDGDRLRTELWNADAIIGYGLAPSAFTFDTWHHVVLTHSVGPHENLFFVDAQLVEHTSDPAAARPMVTSPFTLFGFVGSIDEIAVYDKPLSAARIAAHYAAQ